MREICLSGSEGGVAQPNAPSLPSIEFGNGRSFSAETKVKTRPSIWPKDEE